MTIARTLSFSREDILPEDEHKELTINDKTFDLADKLSTIELVLFSSAMLQSGTHTLIGLDRLFRKTLDADDYDDFVAYMDELGLEPLELAEVAKTIVEMYTLRPTEPS